MKDTSDLGFNFLRLDLSSVKVVVLSNASFADVPGLESNIGFVVLMVDNYNRENMVQYGFSRCHSVARSVIAAELYALFHAFNEVYMVQEVLYEF